MESIPPSDPGPASPSPLATVTRSLARYFWQTLIGHWENAFERLGRLAALLLGLFPRLWRAIHSLAPISPIIVGVGSLILVLVPCLVSSCVPSSGPYFRSAASIEIIEYVTQAPQNANNPNGTTTTTLRNQVQPVITRAYFTDGALVAEWKEMYDESHDGQFFYYHHDTSNSSLVKEGRVDTVKRRLTPLDPVGSVNVISRQVATRIVPGSTRDALSAWRRGFWSGQITHLRDGNLFLAALYVILLMLVTVAIVAILTVAAVFAALAVVATALLAVATPIELLSAPLLSIGRMGRIVLLSASAPRSSPWTGRLPAPDGTPLLLRQVSDLHLVGGGRHRPYEVDQAPSLWRHAGDARGPDTRDRTDRLLGAVAALPPAPLLAYTGDVVDLGEEAEWADFIAMHRQHFPEGGSASVLLIPGNHDVCINLDTDSDPFLQERKKRLDRFREAIEAVERGGWSPLRRQDDQTLDALFPRQLRLDDGGAGVRVLALDSTRYPSRYVLSNAVGEVGRGQLRRLEDRLASEDGPVIVIIHHHVTWSREGPGPRRPWNEALADRFQSLFLITLESRRILDILHRYRRRHPGNAVLLIHGHKHHELFQQHGKSPDDLILIYGHPSSTMGHVEPGLGLDGRLRYAEVRYSPATGWDVRSVPVI